MRLLILILIFPFIAHGQIVRTHPYYRPTAAACSYLLDCFPGASLSYSLRKLDADYSGNLIRVRRSSDNSEQDIGATVNGDLDTSSLKTFVGVGNGFLVTFYDQSGNGKNASITIVSLQPRIVNAGVVERLNTKPALYFDGGDIIAATSVTLNTYNATFVVMQSNANGIICEHSNDAVANDGFFFYTTTNSPWWFRRTSSNYAAGTASWTGSSQIIAALQYNASGGAYYKNNVAQTNNTVTGSTLSNTTTTKDFYIFARRGNILNITGYLQELVLYDSDQSANRSSITSNINTYWGVY